MSEVFNPDEWLVSLSRTLKEYVEQRFDNDLFDVQMSFPDTTRFSKQLPLTRTIIHFEIDADDPSILGFGTGIINEIYDEDDGTLLGQEATWHEVNFDVGIWTSAQEGGDTTRMEAFQLLKRLFIGNFARTACMEFTEGVEPLTFGGGRFFVDSINDLPVWRVADMSLVVRVASRQVELPQLIIDDYIISPGVYVDDTIIVEP